MFRKLSAVIYQATRQQIASSAKWSWQQKNNLGLNCLFGNMKDSVTANLFKYEQPLRMAFNKKLTIVGSTRTGLSMALNCLDREVCNQICLMDCCSSANEERRSQSKFLLQNNPYIMDTKHFEDTRNSDLIVLTKDIYGQKNAINGPEQKANIIKGLAPALVKYSPNSLLFIDTEETEVIHEVATKIQPFPRSHILYPNHKIIQEYMKKSESLKDPQCCSNSLDGEGPSPGQEEKEKGCSNNVAAAILENYQYIRNAAFEESDMTLLDSNSKSYIALKSLDIFRPKLSQRNYEFPQNLRTFSGHKFKDFNFRKMVI